MLVIIDVAWWCFEGFRFYFRRALLLQLHDAHSSCHKDLPLLLASVHHPWQPLQGMPEPLDGAALALGHLSAAAMSTKIADQPISMEGDTIS